jgi:flagellar protein FliO/FliZ
MLDSLFGAEPTVKFLGVFVVVLAVIGLMTWLVRRFGATNLRPGMTRGRQPRLAVIDAAMVDGRRRLVLIRRDNVEHLVMIGGPGDVVIEQNIVRAVPVAAPREAARPPAEAMPRPADVPIPRPVAEPAPPSWLPQQEPVLRSQRPMPPPVDEESWPAPPEPARPPQFEGPAPRAPDFEPPARPPQFEPPIRSAQFEPPARPPQFEPSARRPTEAMPRTVNAPEPLARAEMPMREPAEPMSRPEPRGEVAAPEPAPRMEPMRMESTRMEPPVIRPVPQPEIPMRPAAAQRPAAEVAADPRPAAVAPDVNLADMAQRLEAALRRPMAAVPGGESRTGEAAVKPPPIGPVRPARPVDFAPPAQREAAARSEAVRTAAQAAQRAAAPEPRPAPPPPVDFASLMQREPPPPRPEPVRVAGGGGQAAQRVMAEPRPAPVEAKQAAPKSVLDSLEEEMASLLGRPASRE